MRQWRTLEEAVEETVEETARVSVEDEAVEETVEDTIEETVVKPLEKGNKRGISGAATYRCSFKKEWSARWPFITMGTTSSFYWCSVCRQENSCAHQGVRDISRHVEGKGHRAKEQALNSASSVAQFYTPATSVGGMSVQEAKENQKVSMVQHNVPFAVADHFSPLYKECFSDSSTAQSFKSASTKTTCIINEAVAPHFRKELVMKMRENPFTLITDGSNDTGLQKMNPLTVRIFDTNKVVHRFLDMCTTSGQHCGTAEVIYKKINDTLQENNIPWRNCVGLSIDNAPVNTGAKNSIAARMLRENGSICIHGCPCHIIHNTAKHAGQKFMEITGFDPEDLTVDVGYWFKGSTNRKGYLAEFCDFHGTEYLEILLHISVRWLSLERYEKQPRFRRLVDAFSNPLTEVYLLFFQAVFPMFSTLNLLLQRERSSIFQLHGEMTKFIMKLFARFMKPLALQGRKVHDLYKDPLNQLPGDKLHVGFTTRTTLNRLLEAGDITPQEVQLFQQAALAFLVRAVEYSISKLPLKEALLKHAKCVDVQQRAECGVEDALYFVNRQGFPHFPKFQHIEYFVKFNFDHGHKQILNQFFTYGALFRFQELLPFHGPQEQDKVGEEFLEYQLMDIPMPQDPTTFNLEEFWGSMSSTKNKVTGLLEFGRLSKIAALVLVLPHSNADAKRVFSMVGLNKTKTRNSLALDGTLSSIMTVKMAGLEPQCFKWEPPTPVLKASKAATNTYNKQHK
ncbi:Protein FAM200B [Merluccius polli]|uniref:Protein FAM200B n=1 Tax=Merluccius polli TaxID=89951 RepID=A0AA47N2E2_MERPO|nr:Protein FAM200B [Merluccius polli]